MNFVSWWGIRCGVIRTFGLIRREIRLRYVEVTDHVATYCVIVA